MGPTTTIENEHRFRSLNTLFTILTVALPVLAIAGIIVNEPFLHVFTVVYAAFFIGYFIFFRFVAMPGYFYFTSDDQRMLIRYRPFRLLESVGITRKPVMDMVELTPSDFKGYKIEHRFGGIRRCLIVMVQRGEKVERVAINISFIPIKDLTRLIRNLHRFNQASAALRSNVAVSKRSRKKRGMGITPELEPA